MLALILGLSLAASAQQQRQHKQQVVKPSPQEKSTKGAPAFKEPAQHNASSLELKKLEQETAKSASSSRSSGRQHTGPVMKPEREKGNPPIRFASATGKGVEGGSGGAGKSRVRQKGRH